MDKAKALVFAVEVWLSTLVSPRTDVHRPVSTSIILFSSCRHWKPCTDQSHYTAVTTKQEPPILTRRIHIHIKKGGIIKADTPFALKRMATPCPDPNPHSLNPPVHNSMLSTQTEHLLIYFVRHDILLSPGLGTLVSCRYIALVMKSSPIFLPRSWRALILRCRSVGIIS